MMNTNQLTQMAAGRALPAFLSLLQRASDRDIGRLLGLLERITRNDENAQRQIHGLKQAWVEDRPLGQLLKRVFRDLNPQARYRLVADFILNNSWGPAAAAREQFAREEGFWPPYTFLISPSMRCNLHCVGCYAGEYTPADDLPFDMVDRVLVEGKEMGIYFVTVLGGEPFIRPDMWDMYARHSDVFFQVFTNGTLLTERAVARLAELGNVTPVLSIEGWQAETDARRGPGTFKQLMGAMDRLRQAGVFFGFSAMATRHNVQAICSDEFNTMLVEKGCYFGWHFLYMPVGRDPDLSLMPTPEQRNYLRVHGAARIRATWPMFVADFWNDAPHVGGCIAGGRQYFHINARGDVEPCIFAHFAVDNAKEKSLRQVLRSPFFRGMRARQPFDDNLLLPCQIIDHPHVFREIYAEFRPYPTHPGAEALVNGLGPALDDYAGRDRAVMDPAWQEEFVACGFRPMTAQEPLPEPAKVAA
jgi:MoaA/NifB/PqqE/SkfB family radical SAM enzyme